MHVPRWVIPLSAFALITAWWLFPILSHISNAIPGAGAGDNATFVWNVWWMHYVLHHHQETFFFTPFLFYPSGVDLTLHTHTALPAFIAAVAGVSSPVVGQNILVALHILLNFLCSYALAYRMIKRVLPAVAGSLIFGTSSFVSAHLSGHFNLIAAWTLPLACLLMSNARNARSTTRGVVAGIAIAAAAYTDYYLFVYVTALLVLLRIAQSVDVSAARLEHDVRRGRVLVALVGLLLIDVVVIAGILLSGGNRFDLGPLHISLRSIRNPITAAWILALSAIAWTGRWWVRAVRLRLSNPGNRADVAAIAAATIVLLPLLVLGIRLWWHGHYVSQTYMWRSAPAGVDAATLFLGSPFHLLWGEQVRRAYDSFHIDPIEGSGWIPISAVLLAAAAVASRPGPAVRQWVIAAAAFFTWALGPWLTMFGRQTPLMLPAMFVRFLPIVANARIPGRAMVVVHLGVAMLAGIGFARLTSAGRAQRTVGWCLGLMLVVECLPARPARYLADMPQMYLALRAQPRRGAVCELPLGLRDGFGEVGWFDAAVLLHQTLHERPILGGFVARLDPAVRGQYDTMPVIGTFLRLSSGGKLSDEPVTQQPADAAATLASAGIAFLVLDVRRASPDLIQYVQSRIELRRIGEEDGRIFYEVM